MSTAQERAAAHIDATDAEGHSMLLVPSAFQGGKDGVVTMFDTNAPRAIDAPTAALADSYRHDSKRDRAALRAELMRRGWVK